jgi:hypothetical protein
MFYILLLSTFSTTCKSHVCVVFRCLDQFRFISTLIVIMARHIYGDSNVMKYLPLLKEKKSDPMIQAVTASKATNLVLLRDLTLSPKAAHAVLIISALTNIITAKYFDDFDAMTEHCRTTFNDLLLWLQEGRDHLEGFAEQVRFQLTFDRCFRHFQRCLCHFCNNVSLQFASAT